MKGIMVLSFWQVALAYLFVVLLLLIVRWRGIHRESEILIASVRMTLQLILTGYILIFVFGHPSPLITLAYILVMIGFAIMTIFRRFKGQLNPALRRAIVIALAAGSLSCLFYFLLVVIRISPWYNPQYFIPIAGMIIGNAMTGMSLGIKTLLEGMISNRAQVEAALLLGATPQIAAKRIVNSAFDSAILPTIQSMIGMGIVSLPGMMTGQILSGTVPATAVAYQIAIMLGILGSVSLSVILVLQLGFRTFFNAEQQMQ
jgi:putative ABC transport system permease protein